MFPHIFGHVVHLDYCLHQTTNGISIVVLKASQNDSLSVVFCGTLSPAENSFQERQLALSCVDYVFLLCAREAGYCSLTRSAFHNHFSNGVNMFQYVPLTWPKQLHMSEELRIMQHLRLCLANHQPHTHTHTLVILPGCPTSSHHCVNTPSEIALHID